MMKKAADTTMPVIKSASLCTSRAGSRITDSDASEITAIPNEVRENAEMLYAPVFLS